MDNETYQDIFISIDDSGKLTHKESCNVFCGLCFTSQSERDKFINAYRNIINDIQCSYCSNCIESCEHDCPEIKSIIVKNNHRRLLLNLIKKYYTFGALIKNHSVYDNIIENKASKGRFIDYVQKMTIKNIIIDLINSRVIDPNKNVHLHLFIDEQPTISNGYYDLEHTIIEELLFGISNFNYGKKRKPILFGDLRITLKYRDSKCNYDVQAADILAGTVRRINVSDEPQHVKNSKTNKLLNSISRFP